MAAAGDGPPQSVYLSGILGKALVRNLRECSVGTPAMALERVDAAVDPATFDLLQHGGPYILVGRRPVKIAWCQHVKAYGRTMKDMTSVSKRMPLTPPLPAEAVEAHVAPQLMAMRMREAAQEVRSRYVEVTTLGAQNRMMCVLTTDGRLTIWAANGAAAHPGVTNLFTLHHYPEMQTALQGHAVQICRSSDPAAFYALTRTGRVYCWGETALFATREDQRVVELYEYMDTSGPLPRSQVAGLERVGGSLKLNPFHGDPYLHDGVDIAYVKVAKNGRHTDRLFVFDVSGKMYSNMLVPEACMPCSHAHGRVPKVETICTLSDAGYGEGVAMLFDTGRAVSWYGRETVVHDDVAQLRTTSRACAVLKRDGRVETWGDRQFGGDCSGVANLNDVTKLIRVVDAMAGAFMALRRDGSVASWGTGPVMRVDGVQQWLAAHKCITLVSHNTAVLLCREVGTRARTRIFGWNNEDRMLLRSRAALSGLRLILTSQPVQDTLLTSLPSVAPLRLRM